ncbi:MAG: phosphatidylglycerophosphatase A [Desulfuromonas sp.]|jgi:phosphatidylglycerophosphatase A|uniref:phosphatidylglycerophosphatase A family protein n=1 Tax=Desulfuromonas thiophila TaxID=57664 RepID=UPI0024A80F6A|nr:phosphatidylglycerophosphatase A [Desulfuromonas thiophila]MCK9172867.1 phosphatidylglycerophosphatase A [Desulfuromonas thiophila]MDY0398250.1 phosphatidylglycerophosphatase A [Desulfuromonas thiophila]
MWRRLLLSLTSNGGLGYSPWAPGTVGTLAGIPLYYLFAPLPPLQALLGYGLLVALACLLAEVAGRFYGQADDGRIVIDELVGYLTTVLLLPFSLEAALLGFVFFRLCDIFKPFPASWFDRRLKNGIGVVFDDIVAGLYAAGATRLALQLLA